MVGKWTIQVWKILVVMANNGKFLGELGSSCSIDPNTIQCIDLIYGQLHSPDGIAIDPLTADVYVSDAGNNQILVFSPVYSTGSPRGSAVEQVPTESQNDTIILQNKTTEETYKGGISSKTSDSKCRTRQSC